MILKPQYRRAALVMAGLSGIGAFLLWFFSLSDPFWSSPFGRIIGAAVAFGAIVALGVIENWERTRRRADEERQRRADNVSAGR